MGPGAPWEFGRERGSVLRGLRGTRFGHGGLRVHGLGTRELSEGHLLLSWGARGGWGVGGRGEACSLRFFLRRLRPSVWPSAHKDRGRRGRERRRVALAGELEGQRQTCLRRLPHHTAVGADRCPLHFQVRSGKWRLSSSHTHEVLWPWQAVKHPTQTRPSPTQPSPAQTEAHTIQAGGVLHP